MFYVAYTPSLEKTVLDPGAGVPPSILHRSSFGPGKHGKNFYADGCIKVHKRVRPAFGTPFSFCPSSSDRISRSHQLPREILLLIGSPRW